MANGKNAGRLFADCENVHGYGKIHAFSVKPEVGVEVTCTSCHRTFIKHEDGTLKEVTSKSE